MSVTTDNHDTVQVKCLADLAPFGTIKTKKLPARQILTGLVNQPNDSNIFKLLCIQILEGSKIVNMYNIERLINSLLLNEIEPYDVILQAFNEHTKLLASTLQTCLDNKTYTNDVFIKMYIKYVTNSRSLRTATKFLDNYKTFDNDKIMFHTIKNYMFYKNVVERMYDSNGQSKYMHQIFIGFLIKDDLDQVLSIIKLFNYYSIMGSSIGDLQSKYFKSNVINIDGTNESILSPELTMKILRDIDNCIKSYSVSVKSDVQKAKVEIGRCVDYIKTCVRVGDVVRFMIGYMEYLRERLITQKSYVDIEDELLKAIGFKIDPDLYVKMKFMINDIMSSKTIESKYRLADLEIRSEKYKGVEMANKKIVSTSILRKYAWDGSAYVETSISHRANEPLELAMYLDILHQIYATNHSGHKLVFNYEESTIEFDIDLDKTYTIYASMLQVMILMVLNMKTDGISAKSLSDTLNISLKSLTLTLNSLIKCGLIVRPPGLPVNDTNMLFQINKNWTYPDTSIDIKRCIQQIKDERSGKIKRPAYDETVCKAKLFNFLVENDESTLANIMKFIDEEKLGVPYEDVPVLLDVFVTSGKITKEGTNYKYNKPDDTGTDTDTEPNSSDSELDNADDVHYGADVRHPKEHNELDNHNDNIDLEKDTENSNNDIDLEEDTESGEESEKKSDDDSEDNINNIDLEEDCDEEYSTKFETSSSKSSHSASKESSYSGDNGSSKQSKEDNTASDASEENCCEKDEGITDKEDQEDDCEEAGKNEIEQDEQKNDVENDEDIEFKQAIELSKISYSESIKYTTDTPKTTDQIGMVDDIHYTDSSKSCNENCGESIGKEIGADDVFVGKNKQTADVDDDVTHSVSAVDAVKHSTSYLKKHHKSRTEKHSRDPDHVKIHKKHKKYEDTYASPHYSTNNKISSSHAQKESEYEVVERPKKTHNNEKHRDEEIVKRDRRFYRSSKKASR